MRYAIVVLLIFLTTLPFISSTNFYLEEQESYYFFITLFVCGGLLAVSQFVNHQHLSVATKKVDFLLLGFLLTVILSICCGQNPQPINEATIFLLSIYLFYLLFRANSWETASNKLLATGFAVIWIFQIIYPYFDLGSRYFSTRDAMSIKGTFHNSGPFSVFLVCMFPFLYFTLSNFKNRIIGNIAVILSVVILVYLLYITQSRSSIIALAVVGLFVLKDKYSNYAAFIRKSRLITMITLSFAGIFSFLIYFKMGSTLGRLLIWSVSFVNFVERPLLGYGYGNFASLYPHWQGDFFIKTQNQPPQFLTVADISHTSFNEYIQLLVEIGIIGLTIWIILIVKVLTVNSSLQNKSLLTALKASFLGIQISSLFTYSYHSVPIFLLLFINIAWITNLSIEKPKVFTLKIPMIRILSISLLLICISSLFFLTRQFKAVLSWNQLKQNAFDGDKEIEKQYYYLYPTLKSSGVFLLNYGELLVYLQDYTKGVKVLQESSVSYIHEKTYLLLGNCYENLGKFAEAEKCYIKMSYILPNRFTPRYRLAQLAIKQGDTMNAKTIAKQILNMPVKIPSSEVNQIRSEMAELIEK